MISVVVALYNVEKYILGCVDSILAQDERDFELVFVDDGSTDDTVNVVEKRCQGIEIPWKIIRSENRGQSSARNIGLKNAEGEQIVFIDSDDAVSHDFLSMLKRELLSGDYDFSFCNYAFVKKQSVEDDPNEEKRSYMKDDLLQAFLKREIGFVVPSMMFRRDFLLENDLTFNEEIRFSEDQLFIWEVIFHCRKALYLKKKMYGYFVREKSIMTGSPYKKIMKGFEVFRKYTEEAVTKYPEYKKLIAMILPRWELGTLYSSASLVDPEEYRKMYDAMAGRSLLKRLIGIREIKTYALACVAALSPKALYHFCRKLDLNG